MDIMVVFFKLFDILIFNCCCYPFYIEPFLFLFLLPCIMASHIFSFYVKPFFFSILH